MGTGSSMVCLALVARSGETLFSSLTGLKIHDWEWESDLLKLEFELCVS